MEPRHCKYTHCKLALVLCNALLALALKVCLLGLHRVDVSTCRLICVRATSCHNNRRCGATVHLLSSLLAAASCRRQPETAK
jgi:hypothetical protein